MMCLVMFNDFTLDFPIWERMIVSTRWYPLAELRKISWLNWLLGLGKAAGPNVKSSSRSAAENGLRMG